MYKCLSCIFWLFQLHLQFLFSLIIMADYAASEYNLAPMDAVGPGLQVVRTLDPRLIVARSHDFIAKEGASNQTCTLQTADTATNSVLRWSVTTPGHGYGLDRHIYAEVSVRITFGVEDGASTGANRTYTASVANFGLRQWALAAATDQCNVTFNSLQVSTPRSKIFNALMHYGLTPDDRQSFLSATPHKPDLTPDYSNGTLGTSSRSPFSDFLSSGFEDGRSLSFFTGLGGAAPGTGVNTFPMTIPAGATIGSNYIDVKWYEPIWVPPFTWGRRHEQAMFNLNNLTIALSMDNLGRMFAGTLSATGGTAPQIGIQSIAFNAREEQKLHMIFLTPPLTMPVPRRMVYPYYETRDFVTSTSASIGNQSRGSSYDVNFNNVTLTSLPKRLYFFMSPRFPTTSVGATPLTSGSLLTQYARQADTYDIITNINMTLANQSGRFTNFENYDLYNISRKNGLQDSYTAFNGRVGTVVCLEMGEDITMANPYHLAAVQGNWQLGFTLKCKRMANTNDTDGTRIIADVPIDAHMVVVQTGVIQSEGEVFNLQVGPLTEEMVATASVAPEWANYTTESFYGSGLWDTVKSAWTNYIKPNAKTILSGIGTVGKLAGTALANAPHPALAGIGAAMSTGANLVDKGNSLIPAGIGYGGAFHRALRRRIRGGAIEMSKDALESRCDRNNRTLAAEAASESL